MAGPGVLTIGANEGEIGLDAVGNVLTDRDFETAGYGVMALCFNVGYGGRAIVDLYVRRIGGQTDLDIRCGFVAYVLYRLVESKGFAVISLAVFIVDVETVV